jgi:hypothetical protein
MKQLTLIALVLAAVAFYVYYKREGFMPDSRGHHPCPGDHIATSGPKFVRTSSGDCKLSTDVHDPR